MDFIQDTKRYLILAIDHPWFQQEPLETYAAAIHTKGTSLRNCFGIIDGSVWPIFRPTKYQNFFHNGHKKVRALKIQTGVLPDELIGHMFGPTEGRRHDCAVLRFSGLMDLLDNKQWRVADSL